MIGSGWLFGSYHAVKIAGPLAIWGWMLFLAYVPVPAVEAEAIVTYANNYLPLSIQPGSGGLLTGVGFAVCALLNLLAVRMLLDTNTTVTWWKIAVPILTMIAMIVSSTHWGVMQADPGWYQFSGIFTALPAAGIVFSYLAFRTAIDLGGESANPRSHIPLAVIGSVLLSSMSACRSRS